MGSNSTTNESLDGLEVASDSRSSFGVRLIYVLKVVAKLLFRVWIWISVAIFAIWATGALFFMDFLPKPISVLLAIAFFAVCMSAIVRMENKRIALSSIAAGIVVVWLAWQFVRPSNDRFWSKDQKRRASISIDKVDDYKVVTIRNFRHSTYRSTNDYDVSWSEVNFRVDQIESVWYLVQKFSVIEGLAHTFITFGIRDDQQPADKQLRYVAVSVEIRREEGEAFSPLLGIFKRYEIAYVIGDERDLIGFRTNIRESDQVYLYRTNATSEDAQQMFREIAGRVERLRVRPEFYHTLLNNCTNNIVAHTNRASVADVSAYQLKVILPGYSDRLAFHDGLIGDESESFEALQARSRIDLIAKEAGICEDFSEAIRDGTVASERTQN